MIITYLIYILQENKMIQQDLEEQIKTYGKLHTHYLTELELRNFKICSNESLKKARTIDKTVLTYFKEFDDREEWTIFKELEIGNYRMYIEMSLDFNDKQFRTESCFYNAGIFKDNMVLTDVPNGTPSRIYFLKYDEQKKQYYGKIFDLGLDGNGYFEENVIHELRIPPQTMPRKNADYGYWDVQFYIHTIPKK